MKLTNFSLLALAGKAFAEEISREAVVTIKEEKQGTLDSSLDASAITQFLAQSCEVGNTRCSELVELLTSIENDTYQGPRDGGEAIEAKKLKQLKVLILWLQPEHRFARYCFYGCWCLPDAEHKLFTVGYGKPVDNIDSSCKRQSQCYDCAQVDHSDRVCDASTMGYHYKLSYDPADPSNHMKKSIECLDTPRGTKGSCRRSICECDKRLAEELREHFGEWHVGHHQEQGTFDAGANCIVEGCKNGNCSGSEIACCGNLGSGVRMPYKVADGRRKCCGEKTYDSSFQDCCDGNMLAAVGTC